MSWSTVKTKAIVLTSQPIREVDRLYRAITPAYGKISFVGRGARKVKAKLAAHLESYAVVDLEIVRGRRSVTVISVERDELFLELTKTVEHRLLAQSMLNIVDRYTHVEDPDQQLYQDVYDWLQFLNQSPVFTPWRQRFLLSAFTLRFMERLGYQVQLRSCLHCQESILPLSFRWHTGKGGLVCTDCVQDHRHEWIDTKLIPEEVVTLLRLAREESPERLLASRLPLEHVKLLLELTQELMQYHLPFASETPFWSGIPSLASGEVTV